MLIPSGGTWFDRECVEVVRPPAVDIYGDSGAEVSFPQDDCLVYPTAFVKDPVILGRTPSDAVMTVLGPHGWDIRDSDEMVVRGVRYRVTGSPFDWGPGTEVHLASRKG